MTSKVRRFYGTQVIALPSHNCSATDPERTGKSSSLTSWTQLGWQVIKSLMMKLINFKSNTLITVALTYTNVRTCSEASFPE